MNAKTSRQLLIGILQLAYSGELAAAYAYQGHWKSVRNIEEKNRIKTIEEEEWHHRKLVGEMLQLLGERPSSWKETKAVLIGRTAGLLCHLTGWLAPMYGAGKLESRNVREYEVAARYARDCGRPEFTGSSACFRKAPSDMATATSQGKHSRFIYGSECLTDG